MSRTKSGGYAQLGRLLFTLAVTVALACAPSATSGTKPPPPPRVFGDPETAAYLKQLTFSADTAYFADYPGGVHFEYLPLDTTYKVNWVPLIKSGNRGSVVAKVRNVGTVTFTDGTFTLAPTKDAYIWVGQAKLSNGTLRVGFGVYTVSDAGAVTGEWSLVDPAYIYVCKNSNTHTKPAIHDKHDGPSSDCKVIAQNNTSMSTRLASLAIPEAHAASMNVARAVFAGLGGLWISCTGGCCKVSAN